MRFSPVLISTIILAVATVAVPLVIHPAWVAQRSWSAERLNESTPSENSSPSRSSGGGGILQKLNLTQDQFLQISAARRKYQPLIQDHVRTVRSGQAELRRLMASAAEPSQVKAMFEQVQQRRQELQQLRFDSTLAVRQILTLDQRKAFEAELDRRRSQRRRP